MLDIWDHHEPLLPMQVVAHPLYTLNNQGAPLTLQARGGEYEISFLVKFRLVAGPPNNPLRYPPSEIAGLTKDLVYEPFLNMAGYQTLISEGGTLGGG